MSINHRIEEYQLDINNYQGKNLVGKSFRGENHESANFKDARF
jgi:hypothetical protein